MTILFLYGFCAHRNFIHGSSIMGGKNETDYFKIKHSAVI
jgi:hypothetical protein